MVTDAFYRKPGYINASPYICVDKEAQAGYIKLRPGKVARTKMVHPAVLLDFDSDKRLLGIEILDEAFVSLGNYLADGLARGSR
jgi:uncharacterized protein YuzE